MERIFISGFVGSTRLNNEDGGNPIRSLRVSVPGYKYVKESRRREKVTTWYTAKAFGDEAGRWERFKVGDAISLSGIPTYDFYPGNDGAMRLDIVLNNVADIEWTPHKNDQGEAGQENGHAAQARRPVAVVSGGDSDEEF